MKFLGGGGGGFAAGEGVHTGDQGEGEEDAEDVRALLLHC